MDFFGYSFIAATGLMASIASPVFILESLKSFKQVIKIYPESKTIEKDGAKISKYDTIDINTNASRLERFVECGTIEIETIKFNKKEADIDNMRIEYVDRPEEIMQKMNEYNQSYSKLYPKIEKILNEN